MQRFLDLPETSPAEADVLLLPLPYEGTVSYGGGTAGGPEAIWRASREVETWDEECDVDLAAVGFHSAAPVVPDEAEPPAAYLARVEDTARELHAHRGLVIGVGGEHGLTPPLVAAATEGVSDLEDLTVVQLDAHADLRDTYGGTPASHACAIRRLVEEGARVVAIGIRSADKDEMAWGRQTGRVTTFTAERLDADPDDERRLLETLAALTGDVYLTVDVDALDPALCPGTGTPQPGGLGWWQTLRYLRTLLGNNRAVRLVGADVVETVPQPHTTINEFTAARLVAKIAVYRHGPAPV